MDAAQQAPRQVRNAPRLIPLRLPHRPCVRLKPKAGIGHLDFLDAILAIHVCIVVGYLLNGVIADLGLSLPLFVTCLFAGILITKNVA